MYRDWELWDRYGKETLLAHVGDKCRGVNNPVRDKLAELISKVPISDRNILDIGCGSGIEYMALHKKLNPDFSYTGLDITSEQIEIANERFKNSHYNNVCFSVGDIFDIPNDCFKANAYDIVISKYVLEHLPPPIQDTKYNYKEALINLTKFDCKYLVLGFYLGLGENTAINLCDDGFYRNCYGIEEICTILNNNNITQIEVHFIQTLHIKKKAVLLWCKRK